MRYKVVPRPIDPDAAGPRDRDADGSARLDAVEAVHEALPLVPDSVEDCCVRVVDRTGVPSRDVAREWITFLEALELAEETPRGYRRRRTEPDPTALADAFERRVFGARELLEALAQTGSLTAEAAFEHFRAAVPEWERDRHPDWEAEWRERTRRLLAWSEAFGLVERDGDRYVPVDPG